MALRFVTSAAVVGVAAGTINLSISDCGDSATHGKVASISPTSVNQGTKTLVTGTGTLDTTVADGDYNVNVKALGVSMQKCKADLCGASKCALPAFTGHVDFLGLSCPQSAGTVSLGFDVTVSKTVPSSLAILDIEITSTGSAGKLLCANIHTSPGLGFDDTTVAAVMPTFEEWAEVNGKVYNGPEHTARKAVYNANVEWIEANNEDGTQGPSMFMDMSREEFAETFYTLQPAQESDAVPYLGRFESTGADLPDSIDWVENGAVSAVKNQGSCGSCWAFSTVGSLEGRAQIATGNLQQFSEQQFVDCDKDFGDMGCKGGLMDSAFTYLMQSKGACTEDSYAYKGKAGTCAIDSCTIGLPASSVTGFQDVDATDAAFREALSHGPVSVAIEADTVFQFYFGGIIKTNFCGAKLDHGVLAVGYGTDNGVNYWKVKNSWGGSWGEKGYVRMKADKGGKGQCGILSGPPSYPVISSGSVTV